jgi:shikimate kinase
MIIALIGLPGGGKSTIGRHLARRLKLNFIDTDAVIESQIACSISDFFAREGEEAFRDLESETLSQLLHASSSVVLATGGGIVVRPANRQALRQASTVVYLKSNPDEIFRRLQRQRDDMQRPLLQGANPLGKLKQLQAQRDPWYRQTAHFVIDAGRSSVPMVVSMIEMQLDMARPCAFEQNK